ncbi:choice-of-anchor B family protein [Nocardioides euryhalodurans]|uniref:Choice-of-anchor B family protein n=1 Tax=Nocardioides euryhalodurans TaxID=2518370 RepID=A0A4P7GQI4_9ACTN|nr:choice-of-anchor B family protein [Nocardioides euryhalodurans]QBR94101.1 choice-of-anchor B family protein [Nocardioides euryhalodurans]
MKARLVVAVTTALAAGALGIGASYSNEDKGNRHNATGSEQAKQFREVAGADTRAARAVDSTAARCRGGEAAGFPCKGIDLLSHVSREELGLSFVNDIWGWTDHTRGRHHAGAQGKGKHGKDKGRHGKRHHYALIGGAEGTVFVDITNPRRPDIVGTLPTHSTVGGEFWRDIKVYEDHAYIVSEHEGHQMQVFDLTQLRGVRGAPVTFEETAVYDIGGAGNTHNLNINEDTGYAYLVGTSTCRGGLHMVDLDDPAAPAYAGCFDGHGYIHDTQCVVYRGPDREYRGREICFNANAEFVGPTIEDIENTLSIVDVTDKEQPVALSRVFYGQDGYSHQGWLDDKQRYYIHGDELDEQLRGINTRTRVWDVSDLDDPEVNGVYDNATTSIDHNQYTKDGRSYHSNYTSGLRIYDNSQLDDGELEEVAYFDLYPENDDPTFEGGTWSNYPYYDREDFVAVSSIDRGLFVLDPQRKVRR